MTAFISHSSKDKAFVRQVVEALGPLQVEFDEATFDYTLNVKAIRQALKRASLVAFFLSENSVSSSFVAEEQRQTLEALGRGEIKRILIFAIDATSYKELPDWLREINVVQKVSSAKACARRIQSTLVEIDAGSPLDQLYLGRDEEEAQLRRAVAVPRNASPIALHISGFYGVGRRTYLRKSLGRVLPRYYESFPEVTSSQYQGVEDLYREIYKLQVVSSVQDTIRDYDEFSKMDLPQQASLVAQYIRELIDDGSFLLVTDEFGVFDEEGEYQDYWIAIINQLNDVGRPAIGFAQTRTQPYRIRSHYPRAFHIQLGGLSAKDSKELIALSLHEADVDFTNAQLAQLTELVDGHPFNLRFVVGYAKHYGLENFLRDPRDFVEWKHRRGEEFLNELEFDERETHVIAALAEYRYLSADLLLEITGANSGELMETMRVLQDFCCVEFRDGFFHLASPIREATRRDTRFVHDDAWHAKIAQLVCDLAQEYHEDDGIPIGILEAATFAQARGASAPAYLKSLVLPSHLLMIAREHYDRHLRPQCIEFCKRAYEMSSRMTQDAQVETLRLWGLSAARSNDSDEFDFVVSALSEYTYPTATRVRLFLEGFFFRLKGQLDLAEKRFKAAWELAPRNAHINRELASLYCRQRKYNEAEQYARSTYEIQKTNPYIIDILLETLIGKRTNGQAVDLGEIDRLQAELKTQSQETETLFYNLREAQKKLGARNYPAAAREVEEAIRLNPDVPAAYFLGVDAELGRSNVAGAESYLQRARTLLQRQGQSEGDEFRVIESQVNILIEKKQFLAAKGVLDKARGLPASFVDRLSHSLARAVMFDPQNSTAELSAWANQRFKA